MEKQARILATQMKKPRKARILAQTSEIHAVDILYDQILQLADGADWGDDGEPLVDKARKTFDEELAER